MKLTQRDVELARYDRGGSARCVLWDEAIRGFGLRVYPSGRKSFVLSYRHAGEKRLITLGAAGALTLEQARRLAQQRAGEIAGGVDPLTRKREAVAKAQQERMREVTLRQALDAFLEARKALRPATAEKYRQIGKLYFPDWMDKPIIAITKDKVERRHAHIGQRSPSAANYAMRALRAVLNFAAAKYEDAEGHSIMPENPVRRLTQLRAWFPAKRRRTLIKPSDLPAWFKAVMALDEDDGKTLDATMRDYLLLLLFTGLRRREAAALTWDKVDLEGRTLTVTDTKNGDDHTLPLSDFVHELLARRKEKATTDYVFAGRGVDHIIEAKRIKDRIVKASGVLFILHDLRRTFITVAESLDIPAYALKRLLNHRMSNDVTAGYLVITVDRLRRPMQRITDYILKCAKQKPSAKVLSLPAAVGVG